MPVPGQRIVVLYERTIVAAHDPDDPDEEILTAAYLLLRLTAGTLRLVDHGEVDLTEARRQLADLRHALGSIDALQRGIGRIDKAAGDMRKTAGDLQTDLIARIQALQETITG